MKILHLIDSFDARFERDQVKLIEYLEKKGYDNSVITSMYSNDGVLRSSYEFRRWEERFKRTKIFHVPGIRIPLRRFRHTVIYFPVPKIFSIDFDIIHAYTFATYSTFFSSTIKAFHKAKVVLRSDLSPDLYARMKNSLFLRKLLIRPFQLADAIYTFTEHERNCLSELGLCKKNIWVVPVGIDYPRFSSIQDGLEKDYIGIGYLGRFYAAKGPHRLINPLTHLLREYSDVRVFFAGPVEDINYANRIFNSMQGHPNFKYLGMLDNVDDFYRLCDIVLIPSLPYSVETGSITTLEAMAAGKAVIASNIYPMKSYIENGCDGFLFDSEGEIYALIKGLIEDPNLMKGIKDRARRKAVKYDWNDVIKEMEELYASVIN